MGAPRNIGTRQISAPPNQGGDGVGGKSFGYLVDTGTYRTRLGVNGEQGSYFNAGETWFGITAHKIALGAPSIGRWFNIHDRPAAGKQWGSVSSVARDIYTPAGVDFDSGYPSVGVLEYSSGCPGIGSPHNGSLHKLIPEVVGHWQFEFHKLKFAQDCSGSWQIWVQNLDAPSLGDGPVLDLVNVKTLNPDPSWFAGCQFWHGIYIPSGYFSGPNLVVESMLSMWGQSWQQAWDDIPQFVQFQENSSTGHDSNMTDLGTVLNTNNFPIPNGIRASLLDPPGGGGGGGSVAFPTTGILSSFTGADEDPLSEGGNFLGPIESGQTQNKRSSNKAAVTTAPGSSYWHTATSGGDSEAFLSTIPTLPTAGKGVAVMVRIKNPGNPTTAALYLFVWTNGTGFRYFKMTAGGTFAQLGSTDTSHTLAVGEGIGLAVTGSAPATLQGYYKTTGGVWTALTSTTDGSGVITGGGFVGFQLEDNLMFADDFGGGDIVSGSAPVNTVAPAITGTQVVGSVLTTTDGTWTGSPGPTFTRQWQRDAQGNSSYSNIAGQTASTYTLVDADDGCHIRCVVTASNVSNTVSANSNVVGLIVEPQPANSVVPSVIGSPQVSRTLTVSTGTWSNMNGLNPTYTYQWQVSADGSTGWTDIPSATTTSYLVDVAYLAKFLRCRVTAHNTNALAGGPAASASTTVVTALSATKYPDVFDSIPPDLPANHQDGVQEHILAATVNSLATRLNAAIDSINRMQAEYGLDPKGNAPDVATLLGKLKYGTGSPEAVVTAPIGTLYLRLDGGVSTSLYVKTSGVGNTGWTAK